MTGDWLVAYLERHWVGQMDLMRVEKKVGNLVLMLVES